MSSVIRSVALPSILSRLDLRQCLYYFLHSYYKAHSWKNWSVLEMASLSCWSSRVKRCMWSPKSQYWCLVTCICRLHSVSDKGDPFTAEVHLSQVSVDKKKNFLLHPLIWHFSAQVVLDFHTPELQHSATKSYSDLTKRLSMKSRI